MKTAHKLIDLLAQVIKQELQVEAQNHQLNRGGKK